MTIIKNVVVTYCIVWIVMILATVDAECERLGIKVLSYDGLHDVVSTDMLANKSECG